MTLKEKIHNEVIEITGHICNEAIESGDNQLFWNTLQIVNKEQVSYGVDESIYSGVSGILIFLSEAYKSTQNNSILPYIRKGGEWIYMYSLENTPENLSFYTGRTGTIFTLIQIYKLTQDKKYLQYAKGLTNKLMSSMDYNFYSYDFMNGVAGILLGLLLIYDEIKIEGLLNEINQYSKILINGFSVTREGIIWDNNHSVIKGQCGLTHGASGIAYILLLIGKYFKNNAFIWFAEQAFLYENNQFKDKKSLWPDYRIADSANIEYYLAEYKKGKIGSFTKPYYRNDSWCNGYVGIAFSRFFHNSICSSRNSKKDLDIIFSALINDLDTYFDHDDYSFNLCHGIGGSIELLSEFQNKEIFNDKEIYYAKALAIIQKQKKQYGKYLNGFCVFLRKRTPILINSDSES